MNLTPNFTLEELTASETAERNGWDNSPNDQELANLTRLADFLEQVKVVLNGKPIMISSGLRTKKVNDAVGSRDTSQHRIGCAADFRVPGMTPDQVVRAIIASDLRFDQVIREFSDPVKGGGWTHVSIPNQSTGSFRKQALIIDKAGTRVFA
jgi:hypothetical protein